MSRQGIMGHSMGGHGALTIALRNPGRFGAVSAFAPIASPMNCRWGEKALSGYIGPDRSAWRDYDACALIEAARACPTSWSTRARPTVSWKPAESPELLEEACDKAGQPADPAPPGGLRPLLFLHRVVHRDHLRWHAQQISKA
jgi:S-formylglutathione hydrolase